LQADGLVKRAIQAASLKDVVQCKYLLQLQQFVRGPGGEPLVGLLPYGDCLLSASPEDLPAALEYFDRLGLAQNKQLLLSLHSGCARI
jgi:hypothetical protein